MSFDFSGQIAIVTGASRGIGLQVALVLAKAGCRVLGTGTDERSLQQLHDQLVSQKLNLEFRKVDFQDEQSIRDFCSSVEPLNPDILINNAGINKVNIINELAMEDFDRLHEVNVRAPLLLCRLLMPGMIQRKYGRILNITSVFAHVSKSGRASYSTGKAGLLGMTRALALDSASSGVLVNALSPGFIDTELTRKILSSQEIERMISLVPLGRLGTPEEIAKLAGFLVSRENSFMTGQSIIADGGFVIA